MLLTPLQEILKIGVLLKFLELAVLIQFRLAGVAGCGREQFGVGVVFWRGEVGWDLESGGSIPVGFCGFNFFCRATAVQTKQCAQYKQ